MGANGRLATFSVVHFAVDLACIFLMTAFVLPLMGSKLDWLWCVILYNLFAFAFQLPIGALGDFTGRPGILASVGCFLIAAAYFIMWMAQSDSLGLNAYIILGSVVCGIGNSCFHVGGGISTIHDSMGRAARSGIFVSTGAMGVFLAPKLASMNPGLSIGLALGISLMIVCGVTLYLASGSRNILAEKESALATSKGLGDSYSNFGKIGLGGYMAIFFLLLTVCIRSYTGGLFSYSWKSAPFIGFVFTLGIVLGKMLGGVIGDKVGWAKSSVLSLLASALLFQIAPESPIAGILGVLLFNMTMPITLMAISNLLGKDYSGTAFGMTTLALFLGTLPSAFESFFGRDLTPSWMIPASILFSTVAIYVGITLAFRKGCDASSAEKASAQGKLAEVAK